MRVFSTNEVWEDAREELGDEFEKVEFVDAVTTDKSPLEYKVDELNVGQESTSCSFLQNNDNQKEFDCFKSVSAAMSPGNEESLEKSEPATIPLVSPDDILSQFDIALAKKLEANKEFANGTYDTALIVYSTALDLCWSPEILDKALPSDNSLKAKINHEKSIIYANMAACSIKQEKWDQAVKHASSSIGLDASYLKPYQRRAQAYEQLKDSSSLSNALNDYKTILQLEPNNMLALAAIDRLPREIEAKQQSEKDELMGKLKDLGNKFLGNFGLSTENFQFIKDPVSGGYSVNFKK